MESSCTEVVAEPPVQAVPEFPRRRPLVLSDQAAVRATFSAASPEMSDFTFACLWIWRRTLEVEIAAMDGGLVFVVNSERCPRFALPPFGTADPVGAAKRLVRALEDEVGPGASLRLVPSGLAGEMVRHGFTAAPDPGAADYVYRASDLIQLPGKRFAAKRNWVRRCLAAHSCEYVVVRGPVVAACEEYLEEWCAERDCDGDWMLQAEARAMREAFAAWDVLGLRGGALRVDGRIRAFAVGERLSAAMGVQHFEKADARIPGLYQVVTQWFAREEFSGLEWINREEDLGNEGLRKAKLSYHPARMIEKFIVAPGA
ncbi:MAG: DUF2156 domain-containing protein [Deltaproteobacteria bacterium]|nr:DUF2156 domain-containing protein [Deltaproteobacteria bacterium]